MPAYSIYDCFGADDHLARLSAQAGRLVTLQRIFEKTVPASLGRYARVANLKQGKVVIHADSGAVAAKVLQLTPRLTDAFHYSFSQISEIQVKVQPVQPIRTITTPSIRASIPAASADRMVLLADKLPLDSPLRKSLTAFVGRVRIRGES